MPFTRPQPIMGHQVGIHRNADLLYTFPRRRIVKRFLPDSPLCVSALRGLGSYANVFAIESLLLNRPGQPYLGIGEAVQGLVPAAIANALFNAVGIRLRQIPFKPEQVKAALRCVQVPDHNLLGRLLQ